MELSNKQLDIWSLEFRGAVWALDINLGIIECIDDV